MAATTIKKNAQGFGYKYTDIAEIHNYLESQGYEYFQYTETVDGVDYVVTVPIINGEEMPPRRGCRIITASLTGKTNPAQEQGSGLTYARRYSLLMAFGLATTDDDAQCMTREKKSEGFPDRKKMIEIAKSHYPEDSDNYKKLLATFKANSIDKLTDDQLKAVYSKFEGK